MSFTEREKQLLDNMRVLAALELLKRVAKTPKDIAEIAKLKTEVDPTGLLAKELRHYQKEMRNQYEERETRNRKSCHPKMSFLREHAK